ncbi:membrane protein [Pectobacterium phage vB_PcaM_CBB]|uniref:Putative membrane protein n=1 Tax=Pectobacterium phage vB_PcaM_CBB TaxID=2772511 RepID=A0A1L2CVR4_9CAUD|nr:membrane protein [Pectobacterium phage vB_PcaM_CBB]AMM44108.1 putative membrane protein [Pectobacterium phage vB_PcaM_CBB]
MLYIFINGYTIVFLTFIIVTVLDWVLGIDKLNPYLNEKLEGVSKKNAEVFFPTIALTLLGIFSALMYLCTGFIFFHVIYFFVVFCGLVILGIIIAVWAIFKVLSSIRNFIISKKKQ